MFSPIKPHRESYDDSTENVTVEDILASSSEAPLSINPESESIEELSHAFDWLIRILSERLHIMPESLAGQPLMDKVDVCSRALQCYINYTNGFKVYMDQQAPELINSFNALTFGEDSLNIELAVAERLSGSPISSNTGESSTVFRSVSVESFGEQEEESKAGAGV